jgi:hypothetical protein
MRKTISSMFLTLIVITIIVGIGQFFLHALRLGLERIVCDTQPVKTVTNLHGLDFEVTQADCAFIGSNWETTIHASRTGRGNGSDIFIYGPVFLPPLSVAPVPEFNVSDDGEITVTIEEVSGIVKKQSEWNGIPIHYRIGHIDYPTAPQPSSASQKDKP